MRPLHATPALKMTTSRKLTSLKEDADGLPSMVNHFSCQLSHQLTETAANLALLALEAVQPLMGLFEASQHVDAAEEHADSVQEACKRALLCPGSFYQNAYMSCQNSSKAPVSSVLHITSRNRFELHVRHLDSLDGGSLGWVIFRSAFDMEPIPGRPKRMRLNLMHDANVQALEYDSQLFGTALNLMLGTLRRATCLLLSAFSLEVDTESNAVYCGPRAGILQKFWNSSVRLDPKEEAELWNIDN